MGEGIHMRTVIHLGTNGILYEGIYMAMLHSNVSTSAFITHEPYTHFTYNLPTIIYLAITN